MSDLLSVSPISKHPQRGFSSPYVSDPYTERFRVLQSLLTRNVSRTLIGDRLYNRFYKNRLNNMAIEVTDELATAMEKFVYALKEYLTLNAIPVRGDWLEDAVLLSEECALQRSWLTPKHWFLYELFRMLRDPLPGYAEATVRQHLKKPYSMISKAFERSEFSEKDMKACLGRLRAVTHDPGFMEKLSYFQTDTKIREIRSEFDQLELKLLAFCILEDA